MVVTSLSFVSLLAGEVPKSSLSVRALSRLQKSSRQVQDTFQVKYSPHATDGLYWSDGSRSTQK